MHAISVVVYLEAWCDTQTLELVVKEKIVLVNNFVFGVCLICETTTTCQCHVRIISDVRYLEARCGTHTFELAVLGKNFVLSNYEFRGWFDWNRYDILAMVCICAVPCSLSGTLMRHPDIRT